MKPISIIIPTYNGNELLEKYLPSVVEACKSYGGEWEIIVVDDGSDAPPTPPLGKEGLGGVKYIFREQNAGFSHAMNTGIQAAKGEIIVSLNNDVRASSDFLAPLLQYFDDPAVFSVKPKSILSDGSNESIKVIQINKGMVESVTYNEKIPLNPPLRKGETDIDSPFEKGGRGIFKSKRYILYLGGFDYRKNVVTLLHAYKKFSESHSDIYLTIVGKLPEHPNPLVPDLKSVVHQLGLEEKVIFPGYVADQDLPAYYAHAEMFVFPSLYEGFGLPVLEAMNYGCPVVSSKNSSIPEVAGDAAILVDPHNAEDVANAMAKIADDRELRQTMIQKGLEQARKFSWEKCARETLEVFKNV